MNEDTRITLKAIIMVAHKIDGDIDDVAAGGACSYFRTLKNLEEIKLLAQRILERDQEIKEAKEKADKIDESILFN